MKTNHRKSKFALKRCSRTQRSPERESPRKWPQTLRWLASGALVAYTAIGVEVVKPAFAQAPPGGSGGQQSGPRPGVYPFNIPAGPLDDVVDAFEAATGVELELARIGLASIQSPGVQGSYSAEQALERALRGTAITFQRSDPGRFILDIRGSAETVEVVGIVPTVTSPKFTQPIVDTPQTIAVIPEQVFNEQGARNLTDVLRNTPGITFEAGENGFGSATSNFSMRGVDTTGNVFIDGARDSGNYFRDVFNVEQVEIVKGPSADNGRAGAGGYVNLATKRPGPESFQRLTFGYGFDEYDSQNRPRVAVDLNQRLGRGVAGRLNAVFEDGGMIGRQLVEQNSWGLAPSLAFGLQGATRFSVGYQLVDQNDRPDWGVPGSLMEGMINYDPAAGGDRYRDRFYGHRSDYDDVLSHAVVGRFEHDLSFNLRLRNVTRWSDTDREALYTVPNNYDPENLLATTQRQAYVRDNGSLSNLTNLESTFETGGLRHTLIAGFEATADNSMANRYPTNNELGNPGPTPISNPDPDRPLAGFVGLIPGETADIDLSTVGAYLYDTVQLSRKWLVNGGFRVERYGVSIDSRTAAGEPQGPDGYDRTDVTVGAKAGLVFKPVDRGSFYASISSAPLPPASFLSTPDISREGDNAFPGWEGGPNNAASDVQRATNLELGTKWNVHDDRLTLTAAAFRTKRSNIAMAGTVDGESNTFAGYGEQVLRGVELGATGSLTRAWSIYGGMLLMDSERRHGPEVDAARIAANPGDYGPATTTNGDELAFTPHFSANLWTTYEMPFGLTLGGGVRARTASYVGRTDNHQRIIPNGTTGKLPGFTVLDLMASYRVNRNFTLRFNADNITDHFYPLSSNWPARRIFLGPARNFRISTDVSF